MDISGDQEERAVRGRPRLQPVRASERLGLRAGPKNIETWATPPAGAHPAAGEALPPSTAAVAGHFVGTRHLVPWRSPASLRQQLKRLRVVPERAPSAPR